MLKMSAAPVTYFKSILKFVGGEFNIRGSDQSASGSDQSASRSDQFASG